VEAIIRATERLATNPDEKLFSIAHGNRINELVAHNHAQDAAQVVSDIFATQSVYLSHSAHDFVKTVRLEDVAAYAKNYLQNDVSIAHSGVITPDLPTHADAVNMRTASATRPVATGPHVTTSVATCER
jgi:hypothetical protein